MSSFTLQQRESDPLQSAKSTCLCSHVSKPFDSHPTVKPQNEVLAASWAGLISSRHTLLAAAGGGAWGTGSSAAPNRRCERHENLGFSRLAAWEDPTTMAGTRGPGRRRGGSSGRRAQPRRGVASPFPFSRVQRLSAILRLRRSSLLATARRMSSLSPMWQRAFSSSASSSSHSAMSLSLPMWQSPVS